MPKLAYFPKEPPASPATMQKTNKLLSISTNSEPAPTIPSEEELRLRTEIEALRAALRVAQRELRQYDALLQNARVRESELRAQLSLPKESK